MKINQLIRQLEEAREFLEVDAEVVISDPTSKRFAINEVLSDKGLDGDEPVAIIQSYLIKGSSR